MAETFLRLFLAQPCWLLSSPRSHPGLGMDIGDLSFFYYKGEKLAEDSTVEAAGIKNGDFIYLLLPFPRGILVKPAIYLFSPTPLEASVILVLGSGLKNFRYLSGRLHQPICCAFRPRNLLEGPNKGGW